jgi:hypothetical protein
MGGIDQYREIGLLEDAYALLAFGLRSGSNLRMCVGYL